jgi:hypothetical protein
MSRLNELKDGGKSDSGSSSASRSGSSRAKART